MRTDDKHDAKTYLARLVRKAAAGESFGIASSGTPLVKVVPVNAPERETVRRTGFMRGLITVPGEFDTMGAEEIVATFEGRE